MTAQPPPIPNGVSQVYGTELTMKDVERIPEMQAHFIAAQESHNPADTNSPQAAYGYDVDNFDKNVQRYHQIVKP